MSNRPIHKLPGASSLTGILLINGASAATALKINRVAVTDPGVGNDSSQGYAAMSLWLNTSTNHWWIASSVGVGAAVWTDITSGGANGITRETITVANAFAAGNVILKTAGGYNLAQADSASDANATGIIESASGSAFTVVYGGKCTLTAHGFTLGAPIYLSPTVAGALTATQAVAVGQVDRQMAIALDANTLLVLAARGIVIPTTPGTVTSFTASGGVAVAAGGAITSTGALIGSMLVNAQTGTSYAILAGDRGKLVTHSNGSAIADTIAQAGTTGFESGYFVDIQNRGAGTVTITPTTSTIDGAASLALTTSQGVRLFSDGANYFTQRGGAAAVTALPTGFTSSQQTLTAAGSLTLAHGLSGIPNLFQARLVCQTAELNYSIGDIVVVPCHQAKGDNDSYGLSCVPDATNLNIRFGSNANLFYILNKTTGAAQNIVPANWKIVFKAWL